jgi:acetoin:2,6-dichlorophenolindophenol oxidoreductase subunit alpha
LEVKMPPDLWSLYALMLKSRLFEGAITQLWNEGLISGEMHLGTGEEAIIAGVVAQLETQDAMALDHRGSAALLLRGVDPVSILRELLGCPDGLNGGMGGHMHLFSKEHLAATSGIVGSEGPMAAGFALAAQFLRPGSVAVAFFGEGATNQGMLLESLNFAAAWKLPVLFVCKDDGWAITTQTAVSTLGELSQRVRGFGIPATDVDGRDVAAVWQTSQEALAGIREGGGPAFLHARCVHLEGHFLGFQLIRIVRNPLGEMPGIAAPLTASLLRPGGAALQARTTGFKSVLAAVLATLRDPRRDPANDPVARARQSLAADLPRLKELEDRIAREIREIVTSAMVGVPQ